MYDNDEEIRKKRRNLLFIIVGIVVLIILLIIILVLKSKGTKKATKPENKEITCTLSVEGTKNESGVYISGVDVRIKEVNLVSEKTKLVKQKVGLTDNQRNQETLTITKKGEYTVYGYVQDDAGNKGQCSVKIELDPSEPTCELEVTEGKLGDNDWYVSDVTVKFKTKETNSPSTTIQKYYIEAENVDLETDRVIRAEQPTKNIDSYTVKENQITELVGYVIDSNNTEGKCTLKIKKDSQAPTCTLQVTSGTVNSSGEYTDNPVIEFKNSEDITSDVFEQGIGIEENYKEEKYTVTKEGKTTVVGYVRDYAGNKGTCKLDITKPVAKPQPQPQPQPQPTVSNPSCTLTVSGKTYGKDGDYNMYLGPVTVKLNVATTNGATITKKGIGKSNTDYNGKDTYVTENINSPYTIYGLVTDSYGNSNFCYVQFKEREAYSLYDKATVGQKVDYNAGMWSESKGIPTVEGYFGGYSSGNSKNQGVKCNKNDQAVQNGWIVLAKDSATKRVILVSAGTPECYYHGYGTTSITAAESVNRINQEIAKNYVNSTYAVSAKGLSCDYVNCSQSSASGAQFVTGTHYFLTTAKGGTTLWSVSAIGTIGGASARTYGIRPVVVLKENVMTIGYDTNNGWVMAVQK